MTFHQSVQGSQILYAWAMDADALELPDGVGRLSINCINKQVHSLCVDSWPVYYIDHDIIYYVVYLMVGFIRI